MVIRITQQMKVNMMMQSTNGAMNGLFNVQKQILTGKKFTAPYENPYGASQVVKIKAQLGQLYDWQRNIDDAKDELKNTYDILTEMQENVQRINELAIRLANEANSPETCEALVMEIRERAKTISTIADSEWQGNYIFGGTNTLNPPYMIDNDLNVTYNGTVPGQIWERKVEISKYEEVALNVFGHDILGDANGGYLATVKKLVDVGSTMPIDALNVNALLDDLKAGTSAILCAQAQISSTVNRLDTQRNINEILLTNLIAVRSSIEDTDIIEASSQLALKQASLEASLKISATLLGGPSLLNYL